MNFVERAFIPGIEDSGRPVELLRDHRGIYGIGVSDAFDLPALAWRCGIDNDYSDVPRSVILRPDKLSDLDQHFPRDCAVLQKITGGFRRGPFMNSREEYLRQFNHHEALRRAGLSWPPYDQGKYRWWSNDKGQQMRNRQIYHGLRLLSLHAINSLIGRAIEQCADREALQAARRFAFEHRQRIYRAVARSHRALQLTRSFPLLALCIYSFVWPDCPIDMSKKEIYERRRHAAALIERGVKLRDVAGFLGVPMALRHLKPGVAHLASSFIIKHPGLLAFMPNTVPRARVWLHLVKWGASDTSGLRDEQDDFAAWIARNVQRIPGNRDEIFGFLSDTCDWVRASTADRRFITRPFKPSMSIKTVTALSDKWHEAVVNYMTGPDIAFPEPWFPSAKCGDYDIVPSTIVRISIERDMLCTTASALMLTECRMEAFMFIRFAAMANV